jgi:hypothetical protein
VTLLSVVKDVCAVVGVAAPTSVFASLNANRTMQEMVALANEMAQRIAYDTREWTLLKLGALYTGDGTTEAFNLPVNYKRMLLTGNMWRSTSTQNPMTFEPDLDIGTYGDALQIAMGNDQPAPIIIDRAPMSNTLRSTNIAYPWPVPTS